MASYTGIRSSRERIYLMSCRDSALVWGEAEMKVGGGDGDEVIAVYLPWNPR